MTPRWDRAMQQTPTDQLLSTAAVCHRYGLTQLQLGKWMRMGRLKWRRTIKGVRFHASDIARAIEISQDEPGARGAGGGRKAAPELG